MLNGSNYIVLNNYIIYDGIVKLTINCLYTSLGYMIFLIYMLMTKCKSDIIYKLS